MSLARDFESGEVDTADLEAPQPLVIAVAASVEERALLAAQVGGPLGAGAPVFVVASLAEAVTLLVAAGWSARKHSAERAVADDRHDAVIFDAVPAVLEAAPATLEVDSEWRVASWQGRTVSLSPLEHGLLDCLLRDRHVTWPFERLHQAVWGNTHQGDRSHVHAVVKRLRRKLLGLDSPVRIHTIRGVGLRLVDAGTAAPPATARL